MTIRFAGAASAAVIGLAWLGIGSATAASFSVQLSAETGANGPLNATLTGDTLSHLVSLDYNETNESADGLTFFSTNFLDPGATLARSNFKASTDVFGLTTNTLDFRIGDNNFDYTVLDLNGSKKERHGFTFVFTLYQQIAPDGTIYQYDSSSSKTVLGSVYDPFSSLTTVSGNPLSSVPLPATAPLLGAALLGLGVVGYGMKSRIQPVAA